MSEGPVLVDTGPLVALLLKEEVHHDWVTEQFRELPPPYLTCDAVLAETLFLTGRVPHGVRRFVEFTTRPVLKIRFDLAAERTAVLDLIGKYADLPMSLADACLVRMSEIHDRSSVFTFDRQFRIYRKHGRRPIPTIAPWNE